MISLRAYLDSCILIYLVEAFAPVCHDIETRLSDPALSPFISGAARMECLVAPTKRNDAPLLATYQTFFETMETLPTSESAWDRATTFRANYGLLLPDALHLAIAEVNGCDEFWTADAHFDRMTDQVGVRIRRIG